MNSRPTGTVTFLFTDIEGSTKRWEAHPDAMRGALSRHDDILREAIEQEGGYVFKSVGYAFYAAFPTPLAAVSAAVSAQRALQAEQWELALGSVRAWMALHTGMVEMRDNDYVGQPLNRVACIISAGHGGQVLVSEVTHGLVRDNLPQGVSINDLGEHHLKDLTRPEHIFELVVPDLPSEFPPLRTLDNRPNNLPLQPTPFIGREKELASITALVRRPEVRLVTLTGPGGTSKSRLGLQAVANVLQK